METRVKNIKNLFSTNSTLELLDSRHYSTTEQFAKIRDINLHVNLF